MLGNYTTDLSSLYSYKLSTYFENKGIGFS